MRKILINGLLLNSQYAGVQYSIEYFIEALRDLNSDRYHFTVLVSKNYQGILQDTPNFSVSRVSFDTKNRMQRILFENFRLPSYFKKNGFAFYHSPSYTLPYFHNMPSIVTIHDLIALDFPELSKRETAIYYSLMLPRAVYKSKKIIAVSDTVKEDILERFPKIREEKIAVIHHGLHIRFKKIIEIDKLSEIQIKYQLPKKYLLFVGNLEPKKNLSRIIQVFSKLKKERLIEHQLVIVGKKGWKFTSIFESAKNSGFHKEIKFIGYVEEMDLPAIYSLAELLLFPSLYEGFGLPVIEAMACGCPVIASNRGSLPEISAGNCRIVCPENIYEISKAILDIVDNHKYKNSLIKGGYLRSLDFVWPKAANQALSVYDNLYC